MITIVDYGLGNIAAFANLYRRLNIPVSIARTADDLKGASKLILPGVGHFDHAMELLQQSGMRDTLDHLVLRDKVPVIGICVGMQILARSSEEGKLPGLGWIDADVRGVQIPPAPTAWRFRTWAGTTLRPWLPASCLVNLRTTRGSISCIPIISTAIDSKTCWRYATTGRISVAPCTPRTFMAFSFTPKKVTVSGPAF